MSTDRPNTTSPNKQRPIRLSDETYFRAVARAKAEDRRISEVVATLLELWLDDQINL